MGLWRGKGAKVFTPNFMPGFPVSHKLHEMVKAREAWRTPLGHKELDTTEQRQPRDRHQQPLLPGVVHSLALLSCSSRVTGIAAFCSAGGKETRQWNANPGRQEGGGARWVIRTGGRRRWWRVRRATKHPGAFPLVLTRGAKANT